MTRARAHLVVFGWASWLSGLGAFALSVGAGDWLQAAASALTVFIGVGFYAWLTGALDA
jgi:hypothetical protein